MRKRKDKTQYKEIDEEIIDDYSSMSAGWMRNKFYSSLKR